MIRFAANEAEYLGNFFHLSKGKFSSDLKWYPVFLYLYMSISKLYSVRTFSLVIRKINLVNVKYCQFFPFNFEKHISKFPFILKKSLKCQWCYFSCQPWHCRLSWPLSHSFSLISQNVWQQIQCVIKLRFCIKV